MDPTRLVKKTAGGEPRLFGPNSAIRSLLSEEHFPANAPGRVDPSNILEAPIPEPGTSPAEYAKLLTQWNKALDNIKAEMELGGAETEPLPIASALRAAAPLSRAARANPTAALQAGTLGAGMAIPEKWRKEHPKATTAADIALMLTPMGFMAHKAGLFGKLAGLFGK